MSPRVSVIVPVHNAATTLRTCVEAVLSQEYPHAFEAIFVDNGSTDASLSILRSFEPRIVVGTEGRPGPSAARNTGSRIATAPLLAFTDADCAPQPQWLAELVQSAEETPEATLIGGPILAWRPQTSAERFSERLFDQERSVGATRLPYVISANLCVAAERLVRAGMFDESVPRGEDVDFSYRMKATVPGPFRFAERAVVEHANPNSLGALLRKGLQHGRSVGLVADRHHELRGETAVDRLLSIKRYARIASKAAQCAIASGRAVWGRTQVSEEEWLYPLYEAAFEGAKQVGVAAHVLATARDRTRDRDAP